MTRYLPILSWMRQYRPRWFRADLIAGLTIMALLVPEGMAYAELAGVPPQAAFYAAPIGLLLYAVFGSSRQLVVAVSSGIAVMSASIVGELAEIGSPEFISLTAALAVMAGVVGVIAGLLRLGRIARFFSPSVLIGFVSGLALFIVIKQLPKIFGLESAEGNSLERLIELIRSLDETHLLTLVVGASTVAIMWFLERRFHRIPAALVALVYGIVVVTIFGLDDEGVHVVGEIPAGLALPQFPDVSGSDLLALLPGALGITLVMFAEALAPARRFAADHGYRIREDQELIGLGTANLGAGLFQGFSIGASLSKSAAADAAGGRTQVAGVVAAVATGLVALFLTPLFANLPEATLGAIVIVAVAGMFHFQAIRRLYRLRKTDFVLAVAASLGVLVFEEVIRGLLVAVVISLLALVIRSSDPRMSRLVRLPGTLEFRNSRDHPEGLSVSGLLILRPDEGVFFANAGQLRESIRDRIDSAEEEVRTVLLDLSLTSEIDVPGAAMLRELSAELDAIGVELKLAGVRARTADLLAEDGILASIGEDQVYPDVAAGVLDYVRELDAKLDTADIEAILKRMSNFSGLLTRHSSELNHHEKSLVAELVQELERLSRDAP